MENENNQCKKFEDYIGPIVERWDRLSAHAGNIDENNVLVTGLIDLDRMGAAPHPGDVVVFGGIVGSGRTTLLIEILAYQFEKNPKRRVAYLESGHDLYNFAESIMRRYIHLDVNKIRTGQITDKDFEKIWPLADKLSQADVYFSDIEDLDFDQVCDRVLELVKTHNLEMVVIDGYYFATEDNVRQLKKIAKENNVAIVVTCDISDRIYTENRLPVLSDFEGNKGLVKIADVVWILHRLSYYFDDKDTDPNVFELLVPKNKHGQIGVQHLLWDREKQIFRDMSKRTDK